MGPFTADDTVAAGMPALGYSNAGVHGSLVVSRMANVAFTYANFIEHGDHALVPTQYCLYTNIDQNCRMADGSGFSNIRC